MYPEIIKQEIIRIRKLIKKDKREYESLPEGTLSQTRKGTSYYYTWYRDGKTTGITKNEDIVCKLSRKAFLKERLRRNSINEKLLHNLLNKLENADPLAICNYLSTKHYGISAKNFLSSNELNKWSHSEYEKNSIYESKKIHITGNGIAMRSKDEKEIGNILESKNIAYRYDWIQYFGATKYAPDFSILRESDGKIIYWEHFGMMNDVNYRQQSYKKILHYESCGLRLWDNFIITFPNEKGALDSLMVHNLCELFLR